MDFRKRQTSTATPAKPGGLSLTLEPFHILGEDRTDRERRVARLARTCSRKDLKPLHIRSSVSQVWMPVRLICPQLSDETCLDRVVNGSSAM